MYALDVGNGFTLALDGTRISRVPSIIVSVPTLRNRKAGDGFVQYNGRFYHVGANAIRYPNYVTFATADKERAGVDYSVVMGLYVLSKLTDTDKANQISLVIQLPRLEGEYANRMVQQLTNTHVLNVDNEQKILNISVKNVYQEGMGSFFQAQDYSRLGAGMTVVIDIGAGTLISLLVNNRTNELLDVASFPQTGVTYLANLIAADSDLLAANNYVPVEQEDIIEAIADQSYTIGQGGVNISQYITRYMIGSWWKEQILAKVQARYRPYMKRINRYVVTGGGGELLREVIYSSSKARDLFFVPSDALTANVVGIYEHG